MTSISGAILPALAGADLRVPLATGGSARYLNLDSAASTAPMEPVLAALAQLEPWYSSVHRGTGWASQVFTRVYEAARVEMARFVGAGPDHSVIFVRNTTDAINHFARCLTLAPGDMILTTAVEHHANLLPWRSAGEVQVIDAAPGPAELLAGLGAALVAGAGRIRVVALTGASNVTGEVTPLAEIAGLAHRHDALVFVDAAQLAPHRAIDMTATGVDCLAVSGHKMYAPFGAGILVAPTKVLAEAHPFLSGGGAVTLVTLDSVSWKGLPDRHEAGTPNVLGAAAMAAAARTLAELGMDRVADHERRLMKRMVAGATGLPGLTWYRAWKDDTVDRLGVFSFNLEGMHHSLVAAALSAEYGIGVRNGCFCAQPYMSFLLDVPLGTGDGADSGQPRPGAVRASVSLGTSDADVDRFVAALTVIATTGPRLEYELDSLGEYRPVVDSRALPRFEWLPELDSMEDREGCGPL